MINYNDYVNLNNMTIKELKNYVTICNNNSIKDNKAKIEATKEAIEAAKKDIKELEKAIAAAEKNILEAANNEFLTKEELITYILVNKLY